MVKKSKFREDLWFRLNVFPLLIPPLRLRIEDIPALVQHFIERKKKELKLKETPNLAPGAIDSLMAYNWPGNVRELENVIERAMILQRSSPLRFDDLDLSPDEPVNATARSLKNETLELDALVKRHIQYVLKQTGGKIHGPGGAGEVLKVNPDTLRYRMKKLGIPFRKEKKKA
jgi:transcriptional regulator with GAF, ATPase, and Fis domain